MAQIIREIDTRSINRSHRAETIYERKMFAIHYNGQPVTNVLQDYPKMTVREIEQIIENEGGFVDCGIVRQGAAQLPATADLDGTDLIAPKYGRTGRARPLGKLEALVLAYEGRPIYEIFSSPTVLKAKASYQQILKAIDNDGGYVDADGIIRRK